MKTTRRFFVGAAGAVSAWVVGGRALGNAPASAEALRDAGTRPDAGMRPDAGSPPQPPEGLSQAARERYGKFLDDKQLKLLDAKLGEIEARSKRLHAFKVTNADEPACEFRPVRP
jgi:hypothetical protein